MVNRSLILIKHRLKHKQNSSQIAIKMQKTKKIINNIMNDHGFRRQRDVAGYFGVTPQALSIWIAKDQIPPKHLLKLSQDNKMIETQKLKPGKLETPTSSEELKTVVDYLMRENVALKDRAISLESEIKKIRSPDKKDSLFDRIMADSLFISGRVSDGIITDLDGKWKDVMGYTKAQLKGLRYDREDLIHPDELKRVRRNQEKLKHTESISESRYSTIQRWKHGVSGEYIMLSMVWDVNVLEDIALIVCKPIDGFIEV
tara:strand:+ start:10277 stop:11050 length:774 start_codon:yes stop_codon:yes gene_type:complete